jgi:hypothetical protein
MTGDAKFLATFIVTQIIQHFELDSVIPCFLASCLMQLVSLARLVLKCHHTVPDFFSL